MENPSPPNSIRAHVIVSGTVQGVGYRFSTLDEAKSRGITGWVRNLPDGRVEAVFEGSEEVVKEMIRWCHQGPPTSVVKDVIVEYQKSEGLQQFDIRR